MFYNPTPLLPECRYNVSSDLLLLTKPSLPAAILDYISPNCKPNQTLSPLSCFCQGFLSWNNKVAKAPTFGKHLLSLLLRLGESKTVLGVPIEQDTCMD